MKTTREMVKEFRPQTPPDQVKIISVRQFELTDPDDPESPLREISPKDVSATYCWRLDVGGATYWISQGDSSRMTDALKPLIEDEDPGPIIGTRAKVRLDGKTLRYGPVELYDNHWQRLQALGGLVIQ